MEVLVSLKKLTTKPMDKLFILDFNTTNPIGFEWACLLTKSGRDIEYVHKNKLAIPAFSPFKLKETKWNDFSSKHISKNSKNIVFLPWLPPRKEFFKFSKTMYHLRVHRILWLDHNPTIERSVSGVALQFLRKTKNKKFIRIVHESVKDLFERSKINILPHPIFFNYISDRILNKVNVNKVPSILYFGRICRQKGADLLPEILSNLDNFLNLEKIKLEFTIIGQIDSLEPELFNALKDLNLNSIALKLKVSSSLIPEQELLNELIQCDLVFAPYRDITESGTASLALALSKPVFFVSSSIPNSLNNPGIRELVSRCDLNSNFIPDLVKAVTRKNKELDKNLIADLQSQYISSFTRLLDFQ
jgi:glycosyltransferase involved in cell wall biosynthesis